MNVGLNKLLSSKRLSGKEESKRTEEKVITSSKQHFWAKSFHFQQLLFWSVHATEGRMLLFWDAQYRIFCQFCPVSVSHFVWTPELIWLGLIEIEENSTPPCSSLTGIQLPCCGSLSKFTVLQFTINYYIINYWHKTEQTICRPLPFFNDCDLSTINVICQSLFLMCCARHIVFVIQEVRIFAIFT